VVDVTGMAAASTRVRGGAMVADLGRLRAIVRDTDPRGAVQDRVPLLPPMERLLGRGPRRGAVVAIEGQFARSSLAMAMLAGVSADGGWCGVVGVPSFGCVAAAEFGVRMDTLVLVPQPGEAWAEVTAALLSGLDAVLVQPPGPVSGQLARRLAARARQHRCTVLTLGSAWEGSDVRVAAVAQEWFGVRSGHGRLRSRRIRVAASNRPGVEAPLWLPAEGGGVGTAEVPTVLPLRRRHVRAS
jgi:hypothetical protein